MNLTGDQFEQLHRVFLSAFPTEFALRRLYTYTFGRDLKQCVGGGTLEEITFELLIQTQSDGTLSQLVAAAIKANPGNPDLQRFAAIWPSAPKAAPEAAPALSSSLQLALNATFEQEAYAAGEDPLARFLLEFQVPPEQLAETPGVPTALTLVLDVSGSMNSPDRYPLLRQAVWELGRHLHPADRLAIVLFSNQVATVLSVDDGKVESLDLNLVLAQMDASPAMFGNGTYLAPALEVALQQVRSFERIGPHSRRVYVLTDGELHDGQHCPRILQGFSRHEIEVHIYGFGTEFNPDALRKLLLGQLGGSVKPICTETDILTTFAHIAAVTGRIVAEEAELIVEFDTQVDPHEAWSFRPQERLLGRVHGRQLRHAIGALEAARTYAYLFELRLPPGTRSTRVAQASVRWRRNGQPGEKQTEIAAARVPGGSHPAPRRRENVTQAYTILHRLRVPSDSAAELAALHARREVAVLEHRHPDHIAALDKQIAVSEGRATIDSLTEMDLRNLNSDASTHEATEDRQQIRGDALHNLRFDVWTHEDPSNPVDSNRES